MVHYVVVVTDQVPCNHKACLLRQSPLEEPFVIIFPSDLMQS